MARDYTITAPDGTELVITGPENASPQQLRAAAEAAFKVHKERAPQQMSRADFLKRELLRSPPVAMARGLKDIVDTGAEGLAWLYDKATGGGGSLSGLVTGQQGEAGRVRAMNQAGRAEFDAAAEGQPLVQAARIGGNLAATVPAVNAAGAMVGKVAPRLGAAISSGGAATGAAPAGVVAKAGDMGIRMAGGALGGGAAAAMVNPEDAGTGAALGGALPPVLAGLGRVGQAGGAGIRHLRNPTSAAADDFARAMGPLSDAEKQAVVQQLRTAAPEVDGSAPTVAQALRSSPQASILERVVSDSPGGAALKRRLQVEQPAARMAALEGVAPTHPAGYQQAQADFGTALERYATSARDAAKAKTRAAYEAVPQDEAALYLPDLAGIRDQFFGRGVFGGREAVDQAVSTAQRIGTMELPALAPTTAGRAPQSLAAAVRRDGGMNTSALGGELAGLRGQGVAGLTRRGASRSVDQMAERMREAGYIGGEGGDDLVQALRAEAEGRRVFSPQMPPDRQWRAAQEAAMGPPPGAEATPAKVTLREFDNLRKSIGAAQRAAAREPGRAAEAAALTKMKAALDDRVNEVVRGDGAADEVLPIAWADALDQARKLKLAEVERFMTGPQAALFRKGADGQPLVQGREVAGKFWGAGLSAPEDVKSFRRLIDDNPQLLGQFRSMVTSEGEATKTAGGALSSKFARWVETRLPGLRETFTPAQVKTLQKIAADIERAEAAAAAGASKGSPTYANAANALDLGILDSKALGTLANVPGLRWASMPMLDAARGSMRQAKAGRLADVLMDPQGLAAALEANNVSATNSMLLNALLGSGRAAPVLAADR